MATRGCPLAVPTNAQLYTQLQSEKFSLLRFGDWKLVQPTDNWVKKKTDGGERKLAATDLKKDTHFTFRDADGALCDAFKDALQHVTTDNKVYGPSISVTILRVSADIWETLSWVKVVQIECKSCEQLAYCTL